MPQYTLEWKSTVAERYDTDMNERAAKIVVEGSTAVVMDSFGGSGGDEADNGFDLVLDNDADASVLAKKIATEVGHDVLLTGEGFTYTLRPEVEPT